MEVAKVLREAECWTDHRLIKSVLTMHIIPTHHKKKIIRPSFNVSKLTNISRDRQFAEDLGDRLTSHRPMTGSTTVKWNQFKILRASCSQATSVPARRVPVKTFKAAGPAALIPSTTHLSTPGRGVGGEEDMSKDFRDAIGVPLFNHVGSKVV
ncbi:hypothetical protein ElyMa_006972300 [Elysia marginata]|uniref:Uncharacterized protein n=1 Tax=Elysia marginata TaxID=1093978 RepID=A0AAV4JKE7_9GAST|nr:hypothetical protein ElyMa_006972300 [Elysia marginata]